MRKHCCPTMQYHVTYRCDQHPNPFDCPDNVILYDEKSDSYGLIIHDGGISRYAISFCPWCGSNIGTKRRIKRRLKFGKRISKRKRTVGYSQELSQEESEAEWRRKQIEKNQAAIQLLDSWLAEEETQEQRETWEFLKKALDEDRLSYRKLFPDE